MKFRWRGISTSSSRRARSAAIFPPPTAPPPPNLSSASSKMSGLRGGLVRTEYASRLASASRAVLASLRSAELLSWILFCRTSTRRVRASTAASKRLLASALVVSTGSAFAAGRADVDVSCASLGCCCW
ncbi:hypothetical protein Micbo1qcDRAFT_158928, partial [Microdochium bolleyi]